MRVSDAERRLINYYREMDESGQQIVQAILVRLAGSSGRPTTKPRGVSLRDASKRLGFSYQTGRRKVAEGTFPVPLLPRRGREWHKVSEVEIDRYLSQASTADAI